MTRSLWCVCLCWPRAATQRLPVVVRCECARAWIHASREGAASSSVCLAHVLLHIWHIHGLAPGANLFERGARAWLHAPLSLLRTCTEHTDTEGCSTGWVGQQWMMTWACIMVALSGPKISLHHSHPRWARPCAYGQYPPPARTNDAARHVASHLLCSRDMATSPAGVLAIVAGAACPYSAACDSHCAVSQRATVSVRQSLCIVQRATVIVAGAACPYSAACDSHCAVSQRATVSQCVTVSVRQSLCIVQRATVIVAGAACPYSAACDRHWCNP